MAEQGVNTPEQVENVLPRGGTWCEDGSHPGDAGDGVGEAVDLVAGVIESQ